MRPAPEREGPGLEGNRRMSRPHSARLGRRAAIGVLGSSAIGAAAIACGGPAAPTPAPAKTESKPAASESAAKPATEAKPAETAKPADAAATKPPAAGAAAAKPGRSLIGKMEGPSVVVDSALYPKAFKEAPALADLVKAGKLPPVEKRLP